MINLVHRVGQISEEMNSAKSVLVQVSPSRFKELYFTDVLVEFALRRLNKEKKDYFTGSAGWTAE